MTLKASDIKIATKDEAMWIKVKEDTCKSIEELNKQLKFLKAVDDMAAEKIKLEGGK